MKRFLFSTFAVVMSLGTFAAIANAQQVSLGDPAADLNGDGEVTLNEVRNYNRDQRQKN